MSVAMVGAAVATVGAAAISANAASKSSKAQQASAQAANDTQLAMFNQNRDDQAPWRDAGKLGLNELAYRLGLSTNSAGAPYQQTSQQVRDELLPLYKREISGAVGPQIIDYGGGAELAGLAGAQTAGEHFYDEAGLRAAIEKRMAEQKAAQDAYTAKAKADPNYGSLLRNFSAADMQADPVYQSGLQFGLTEGQKGIDRAFAARGGVLSGAAAKAMARFGNDYASTKANESYNRFNNNQTQIYNRLAGISGTGQNAATQIATQGAQVANSIGQNTIGAGNARASGYISGANALTGAIGQGYNIWQQNQMMNNSSFAPNISGSGYNPYANYSAVANGGWGIE